MTLETRELYLLLRAGKHLCALPLAHVDETMRPQPVRAVAGMPSFVRGVARIRGKPVPVVDTASVLDAGEVAARPTRFVSIKTDGRRVALAVDEVVGVRALDYTTLSDLPRLLDAAGQGTASTIGVLDKELLLVLQSGKFVPDDVWSALASGEPR